MTTRPLAELAPGQRFRWPFGYRPYKGAPCTLIELEPHPRSTAAGPAGLVWVRVLFDRYGRRGAWFDPGELVEVELLD